MWRRRHIIGQQDPNQAINLDFNELLQRGSEHFSENSSHFILPAGSITPQLPSSPTAVTPPNEPNAPAQEMPQPMSPEDAGAVDPMSPETSA